MAKKPIDMPATLDAGLRVIKSEIDRLAAKIDTERPLTPEESIQITQYVKTLAAVWEQAEESAKKIMSMEGIGELSAEEIIQQFEELAISNKLTRTPKLDYREKRKLRAQKKAESEGDDSD